MYIYNKLTIYIYVCIYVCINLLPIIDPSSSYSECDFKLGSRREGGLHSSLGEMVFCVFLATAILSDNKQMSRDIWCCSVPSGHPEHTASELFPCLPDICTLALAQAIQQLLG